MRLCANLLWFDLDEEKRTLPDFWYKQEYNCEFVETVDSVFSHADITGALTNDVTPLFPVSAADEYGALDGTITPFRVGGLNHDH